jgi:hypothetical protein
LYDRVQGALVVRPVGDTPLTVYRRQFLADFAAANAHTVPDPGPSAPYLHDATGALVGAVSVAAAHNMALPLMNAANGAALLSALANELAFVGATGSCTFEVSAAPVVGIVAQQIHAAVNASFASKFAQFAVNATTSSPYLLAATLQRSASGAAVVLNARADAWAVCGHFLPTGALRNTLPIVWPGGLAVRVFRVLAISHRIGV